MKNSAEKIKKKLHQLGYENFPLGHAYEVIAALNGDKSWNVTSTKEKKMKLDLNFTDKEIENLYHTAMASFISEQEDRFEFVNEADEEFVLTEDEKGGCYLRWCDTFLEAKVLCTFLNGKLVWDTAEDHHGWCVWSKVPI